MIVRALRALALLPVRLYQRVISPLKPATCRFEPSCSHYAVQAVERHGVLRGGLITSLRILRCNPFSAPGPDPVPGEWRRAVRLRARKDAQPPRTTTPEEGTPEGPLEAAANETDPQP